MSKTPTLWLNFKDTSVFIQIKVIEVEKVSKTIVIDNHEAQLKQAHRSTCSIGKWEKALWSYCHLKCIKFRIRVLFSYYYI